MKYLKWPIYATSEQKTELSNLAKNEIVLPPKQLLITKTHANERMRSSLDEDLCFAGPFFFSFLK